MRNRRGLYLGIAILLVAGVGLWSFLTFNRASAPPFDSPAETQPASNLEATVVSTAQQTQLPNLTQVITGEEEISTPSVNAIEQTATAFAQVVQSTAQSTANAQTGGSDPAPSSDRGDEPGEQGVEIASVNLLIRSDVSGEVIGDGTIRVYAPSTARYPDAARVELELNLDNQYITPTPNGQAGTPVPRSTSVASPGGATPTPYLPIITDSGVPVYQRMGATLYCSPGSFNGCDLTRDLSQTKIINARSTTWSWLLSPSEAVRGLQELRIETWLVERNLDGALEFLDLPGGQYRFSIEVNPSTSLNPALLLGAGLVVLAAVGGVLFWRRRSAPTPTAVATPRTASKEPLVFISYRRGLTWGQARSIEQSLRKRGANVFIDIDDINEGKFAETIQKAIADCDFFLAVLAPGTLESVWVRREIAHAIALKKVIVPLLIDGFRLDADTLPPDIQEIASHNAITVLPEFYEEAMDRLATRFLRLGN
jgi:hypothetical protein